MWKPSVTFPLCLSHVRKLLVTLPLPFFINCLQEQCKIWVRAAPSRGRFWHQWQCTHPPTVIIRFFERTAIKVLKKWHRTGKKNPSRTIPTIHLCHIVLYCVIVWVVILFIQQNWKKSWQTKTHFSQCFPIVWPKRGIPWESWRPGASKNVVVFEFWRF